MAASDPSLKGILVQSGVYQGNATELEKRIVSNATPKLANVMTSTDTSATPGNATINTCTGRCAVAATAATIVITNSLVTLASKVFATLSFADATATSIKSIVYAAGSFTITLNATATAATQIDFMVVN